VLVHLGSGNFLDRYKVFVGHVREWRQQFERLDSVDLRYDNQIVVNPDTQETVKAPAAPQLAVKTATAASVKPAVLVTHDAAAKAKAKIGPFPVAHKAETKAAGVKPVAARKKTAAPKHAVVKKAAATVKAKAAAASSAPKVAGPQLQQAATTTGAGSKPSPAIPKGQEQ
jgi:cell division protein FtsQ